MSEAVRKELEIRAVCPVTKGLPVRMTEHGFASACAAALAQAREAVQGNSGLSLAAVRLCRCLQCLGKDRPPELLVVDLECLKTERGSAQPEKELDMGLKKTQDGTCKNCGRNNMTLTRLHGDLVCSSCGNLLSAMANRPEAVENALRKMLPHFLPAKSSSGEREQKLAQRCDELAAEVQALADQLVGEQDFGKKRGEEADRYWAFLLKIGESVDSGFDGACDMALVPEMVTETLSDLQAEKNSLQQQAERLTAENTVLAGRVSELEIQIKRAYEASRYPNPGEVSLAVVVNDLYEELLNLQGEHGKLKGRLQEELNEHSTPVECLLESTYEHDLMRDQLADFALKVLQGQVGIVHRDA
ncbi:MAG: TFIIB-type zinc ribbon-containing protein [Desulfobulbus sp.]